MPFDEFLRDRYRVSQQALIKDSKASLTYVFVAWNLVTKLIVHDPLIIKCPSVFQTSILM